MLFGKVLDDLEALEKKTNISDQEISNLFLWISNEISEDTLLNDQDKERLLLQVFSLLSKAKHLKDNKELQVVVNQIFYPFEKESDFNKLVELNKSDCSINSLELLFQYIYQTKQEIYLPTLNLLKQVSENNNNEPELQVIAMNYRKEMQDALNQFLETSILSMYLKSRRIKKASIKFKAPHSYVSKCYSDTKKKLKGKMIQLSLVYGIVGLILFSVGLTGTLSDKGVILVGMLLIGFGAIGTSIGYIKISLSE